MLTRSRVAALPVVLLLAAGLASCGDEDSGEGATSHGPVTSAAIADIVADHVDAEPREVEVGVGEDQRAESVASATLLYGEERGGHTVAVAVFEMADDTSADAFLCESDDSADGCERIEGPGGPVLLSWQEEEPEEDPGIILVSQLRGTEVVSVYFAGDEITGDPRDQRLPVSVDTMIDIVRDGRLTLG